MPINGPTYSDIMADINRWKERELVIDTQSSKKGFGCLKKGSMFTKTWKRLKCPMAVKARIRKPTYSSLLTLLLQLAVTFYAC